MAAIGPGTAAELERRGVRADVVPERFVAEALVEALEPIELEGRRVLVARAAEARSVLPDALRGRGAEVDDVALYETVAEPLGDAERAALERATYVTFTSSSTVRFLLESGVPAPRGGAGRLDRARDERHRPGARADGARGGRAPRRGRARRGADGRRRGAEGARVIVTLLTDYGSDDDFVGVCHGVIRSIHPEADIVDITHGIERYAVRQGALVLRNTLPYMPVGVHVAVVDPQVGTERRAVALRTGDGRILVGPDNGLLSLAWERCDGVDQVVDITRSPHRLEPVSATFHGRDIFAPVGAALARGAELADAGDPLDPETLARVELPEPRDEGGAVVAHALVIDHFGNVGLNVDHERLAGTGITLGGRVEVEAHGERYVATYAQTFADVSPGELIVYQDAYRTLALAINRGDAAGTLALKPDDEVRLRPQ